MTTRTVAEIAELCGAAVDGDAELEIRGPSTLAQATPTDISFLAQPKYRPLLESTRAGAVLVDAALDFRRDGLTLLRSDNPNRSFSRVIELFAGDEARRPAPGVHPTAVLAEGVELGDRVSIGPFCVVGAGARLADDVVLHPHVVVGEGARVGAGTELHAGVVLYPRVELGARCLVHANAVLGADGYGFEPGERGWVKVPQCGTVRVEDDVEIGAGTTIDRARFGATRIGAGAKLDDQVHVGHNVDVGDGSLLVAQVGVAGSAKLGKRVMLAGQVGIVGHLEVGDGARVGGKSAVHKDVPAGEDWFGSPARPRAEELRRIAFGNSGPKRLAKLEERIRLLEEELRCRDRSRP